MASAVQLPDPVRFGVFEVDPKAGEIRKNGIKLKPGGQPFQIADTFVDVERNLNTAINKIREVW